MSRGSPGSREREVFSGPSGEVVRVLCPDEVRIMALGVDDEAMP